MEEHGPTLFNEELPKRMAACAPTAGNPDNSNPSPRERGCSPDYKLDDMMSKRRKDDSEESCSSDKDCSMSDDGRSSMDPERWDHVGDYAGLLSRSIRRTREFFNSRRSVARAMCHEHVRGLASRDDVTIIPAEAQFTGPYTAEVVTPGEDQDFMTLRDRQTHPFITALLTLKGSSPDECREKVWTSFKYNVLPTLRSTVLNPKSAEETESGDEIKVNLDCEGSKEEKEKPGTVLEASWP
ncbi:hypothetical protein F5Y11DRAFT_347086 [Daldinia sp. FL1419]|nr:hypothetical protein F5Y11DRAFT_347086 [Daldinia sp. FL1419]